MFVTLHHLMALGVFSLLGWFALLWFVGGAIRARHDARRAEALYNKRLAQHEAIQEGWLSVLESRLRSENAP